jgi:hypothetical protein
VGLPPEYFSTCYPNTSRDALRYFSMSLRLLQLVNYEQTWLRSSVCMACIFRLSDAQVAIASISFVLYVPNWRITILTSIMSKPKYSPMLIS